MERVFRGLTPTSVLIYLDDVLLMARDPDDMLQRIDEVCARLRSAKLRLHPAKCHWSVARVKFLGHIFDANGVAVDSSKFDIILNFPVPNTQKKVRSFLGFANYYRRFIKSFSQISAPLRNILKQNSNFQWSQECQNAFEALKKALITAPVLALPDFKRPFILTTDASTSGIAYVLSQKDESGHERPVAYGGRGLRNNETHWSITDLECLALIEGVKEYHTYLAGQEFEVITDHVSLTYLQRMRLSGINRLTRWALFLQPYKFRVTYRKGALNVVADAISRIDRPKETHIDEPTFELDCENNTDSFAGVNSIVTSPQPFLDDFRKTIPDCPDFRQIFHYLESGQLPQDEKAARRIILEASDYFLDDGILYHCYTPRTKHVQRAHAVIRQLCVPRQYRAHIAAGLHDGAAHLGFDRLYATARLRYYFPGMYVFLRDYVASCLQCQKAKREYHKIPTEIISLPVSTPLSRWHVDFHGPFPESEGKRYILLLIDYTSMWPELIAVEDTSAETVARALFDNVISRTGIPAQMSILVDNAAAFTSKLASIFCKTFGIKRYFITPYHKQSNQRAEQFADTIHNSLRVICQQAFWSKNLQAVAMAYRSAVTCNTGLSPFEVVFGKQMTLDIDWGLLTDEQQTVDPQHHALNIAPKLEILRHIAMQNVTDSATRFREKYNQTALPPPFKTGDKVLLADPVTKKGECAKLKMRYSGPFLITEVLQCNNYRLQQLDSGNTLRRPVHASRLRPLKELDNDCRLPDPLAPKPLTSFELPEITVNIYATDPLIVRNDVFIHETDSALKFATSDSQRLMRLAGTRLYDACSDYSKTVGLLPADNTPMITTAGNLLPTYLIFHVAPNEQTRHEAYYNCLMAADKHSTTPTSITLPIFAERVNASQIWDHAQRIANAVFKFTADRDQQSGALKTIDIVANDLVCADTVSAVFRYYSSQSSTGANQSNTIDAPRASDNDNHTLNADQPVPTPAVETKSPSSWHSIDAVLKRRRYRGKEQFQVVWQGTGEKTWLERKNLTPAAIQSYFKNHPRRRRRHH